MFSKILGFLASIPEILAFIKRFFSSIERNKKTKRLNAVEKMKEAKTDKQRSDAVREYLKNL